MRSSKNGWREMRWQIVCLFGRIVTRRRLQGPAGHCICPSVSCDEAVFRSKLHHRCFSMPHYESRSLLVRIHRPSVGEYRSMIPQLARHDGHSEPLPRCHRRAEKKDRPRFKYPHQSKSRIAGCRRALCRLSRSSILVASQPESSVFLCLQLPRHAPHRRHFAPPAFRTSKVRGCVESA